MENLLRVGVITSAHGVRGEVKVFPTTDDNSRFKTLKHVLMDTGKEKIPLEIEHVKFFKNMVILKFKGFDNKNDVEMWRQRDLLITRDQAVELAPDENFIADLIGLTAVTDEGVVLGTLTDVLQTGANDVYCVKMENGKELLLPAIKDCILNVDLEKQEMLVHVLDGLLDTSILGRAASNGLLSFEAINIRDYTLERHGKVDDYPYGGGAGMVMQAEPIYRAYTALCDRIGHRPRVVYMTPQGRTFTQKIAEELAKEEELVFLCGHYEGVDERVLEMIATDYLSAGDYVLTGGELPAMMMIDCISRLVPGVLNNDVSAEFESFHDNLLEYPQYSRPEEFMGRKVPEILLSGHHANIEKWRREQSIIRTLERRPELLEEAVLSKKEKLFLEELLRKKAENQEEDTI